MAGQFGRAFLIVVLVICPLLLGSNRAAFWALNGTLAAVAMILMLIETRNRGAVVGRDNPAVALLLALYIAPLIWIVVQWLPGMPGFLAHPAWSEVAGSVASISVNPHQSFQAFVWWAGMGVAFVAMRAGQRQQRKTRLLHVMLGVQLLVALFGMATLYLQLDTLGLLEKIYYQGWLTSTFVNRNSVASFLSIGLAIAASLTVQSYADSRKSTRDHRGWARLFLTGTTRTTNYGFAVIIMASALLLTGSRGGILSGFAALVLVFILEARQLRIKNWTVPAFAFAAMGMFAVAVNALMLRANGAAESAQSRLVIWQDALNAIAARPILGHGAGTYQSVDPIYRGAENRADEIWNHAHSTFLEAASGLGVPFTLLWLAGAFWLLWRLFSAYSNRQSPQPATTALIAVLIPELFHAMVDFSFQVQAVALYFACLLGLALAEQGNKASDVAYKSGHAKSRHRRIEPVTL